MADICLRALREPEARNKTFDVCYEYQPEDGLQVGVWVGGPGGCACGQGRGAKAGGRQSAPGRAYSSRLGLHVAVRSFVHMPVSRSPSCVHCVQMYELVASIPQAKGSNYLAPALATLQKNT